jgi:phosphoribosylformimino-5-aminoimidazole carboxamide ribotide isomerase
MEDIDYYLSNGITRVVLGSAAVNNPALVKTAVKVYADRIAVGIDAKDGMVAVSGWTEISSVDYISLARRMEALGVEYIIYTDISSDGMLCGPNTQQLIALNAAVSCRVIASGGITTIEDIICLRDAGLYGAICGRSIYKGTLDLKQAVEVSGE